MVPSASGGGYWQAATSGELLAFGDAADLGSGVANLTRPVVGMAVLPQGGRGPSGAGTPAGGPAPPGPAPAAPPPPTPPVPAGQAKTYSSTANPSWGTAADDQRPGYSQAVKAFAESGNRVFVGGEFAGVVPHTLTRKEAAAAPVTARPFLAALDVNTGAALPWDVPPDDSVRAMAVSADRRTLYVGGRFSQIAGGSAPRLAAIDIESGRLVPGFQPPAADHPIKALALYGNTLYVGGDFEHMGDAERSQVAAVDAITGALRDSFVPPANNGGYYKGHTGTPTSSGSSNGAVHDLGVTADGRYVVVGGDFLDIDGHGGLIVLDAATGAATPWQPEMDRPVFGVAMWPGDNRTFFVSTGGSGGTLQAFRIEDAAAAPVDDSSSGHHHRGRGNSNSHSGDNSAPPLWIHRTDGDSTDVVATTERVILVGHYDYVLGDNTFCHGSTCTGGRPGDVPNRHISVFEPHAGAQDTGFTAQLNTPQGPYAALVGANSLYIVGDFTECNGMPQPGFVQFPALR